MSTILEPGPDGSCIHITNNPENQPVRSTAPGPCPTQSSALPATSTPANIPANASTSTPVSNLESAALTSTPTPGISNGTIASTSVVPGQPGNGTIATTPALSGTGNKGLKAGPVAGIAIGMFLVGALVAGAVFFFLLRRQKKQHAMSAAAHSRQHTSYAEQNKSREKGATVVAASVGSIDDLIPQPVEDDMITGDLSKIRDNIKNHVRTYYHSGPISAAEINEASIRDITALTGASAAVLVKALTNPVTRDSALRSIAGSIILSKCNEERSPSLLPNDVAALSSAILASNGTCKLKHPLSWMPTDDTMQRNQFCSADGKR